MPPKTEAVRSWFEYARTDMQTAQYLLQHDPPLLRQACFHLQQALEKTLKGVLLLNDQRPPRTHSLADLVGLCERWTPGLSRIANAAEWLTAYAEDERYPGPKLDLSLELANRGLTSVQEIMTFVYDAMPKEVRP